MSASIREPRIGLIGTTRARTFPSPTFDPALEHILIIALQHHEVLHGASPTMIGGIITRTYDNIEGFHFRLLEVQTAPPEMWGSIKRFAAIFVSGSSPSSQAQIASCRRFFGTVSLK